MSNVLSKIENVKQNVLIIDIFILISHISRRTHIDLYIYHTYVQFKNSCYNLTTEVAIFHLTYRKIIFHILKNKIIYFLHFYFIDFSAFYYF